MKTPSKNFEKWVDSAESLPKVPKSDAYHTPQCAREIIARLEAKYGGWAAKYAIFHSWRVAVPPEYFHRTARRRGQAVHAFEGWAFSRQMRDLDRRGEIVRRWLKGEKPHAPNSLWMAKLTRKGRINLKKYGNRPAVTRSRPR